MGEKGEKEFTKSFFLKDLKEEDPRQRGFCFGKTFSRLP